MSGAGRFTKEMVAGEIRVLRRLHGMLENDPIETRGQFGDLMRAAFGLGRLDPRQLSDDLGYSISAVYRWVDGRTAPHSSLWPRIVIWVREAIEKRVAQYTDDGSLSEEEVAEV